MSSPGLWIDGVEVFDISHAISAQNRAFQYGDGLFETMLSRNGRVRLFAFHMDRLMQGCRRLRMREPDVDGIVRDVQAAAAARPQCILKLLVSRGGAGRGYKPDESVAPRLFLFAYELSDAAESLHVRWCESRYARNAQLAGIKHLNRLEQILAQAELNPEEHEGLMLDTDDALVSATSGNVFLVKGGQLLTPELTYSGIEGVMRRFVLERATALRLSVRIAQLRRRDVDQADELFVTNAIRGVRPVVRLEGREIAIGPITRALKNEVEKL